MSENDWTECGPHLLVTREVKLWVYFEFLLQAATTPEPLADLEAPRVVSSLVYLSLIQSLVTKSVSALKNWVFCHSSKKIDSRASRACK